MWPAQLHFNIATDWITSITLLFTLCSSICCPAALQFYKSYNTFIKINTWYLCAQTPRVYAERFKQIFGLMTEKEEEELIHTKATHLVSQNEYADRDIKESNTEQKIRIVKYIILNCLQQIELDEYIPSICYYLVIILIVVLTQTSASSCIVYACDKLTMI